jgi:hypothetical protein
VAHGAYRHLAGGEMVVYGALSTHRQPDGEHVTIPLPVRARRRRHHRDPRGRPLPLEEFADAVRLAETPGHGGKPLLLFEG